MIIRLKIKGKFVFKWLLFRVLSRNELSLNVLMNIFETVEFKSYSGIDLNLTVKHKLLADRLSSINVDFIQGIFKHLNP